MVDMQGVAMYAVLLRRVRKMRTVSFVLVEKKQVARRKSRRYLRRRRRDDVAAQSLPGPNQSEVPVRSARVPALCFFSVLLALQRMRISFQPNGIQSACIHRSLPNFGLFSLRC